jgi:mannitol/fructose-specific phosphotransferase system IIA component (Ntr-type)
MIKELQFFFCKVSPSFTVGGLLKYAKLPHCAAQWAHNSAICLMVLNKKYHFLGPKTAKNLVIVLKNNKII